jgi:glycerol uptake facilitator-like aquaporin
MTRCPTLLLAAALSISCRAALADVNVPLLVEEHNGVARAAEVVSAGVPFAVGAYITAAYWFTASTSFANPAVTLARMTTNTFAGIRPVDVPVFLLAQAAGATGATVLCRWLIPVDRYEVIDDAL